MARRLHLSSGTTSTGAKHRRTWVTSTLPAITSLYAHPVFGIGTARGPISMPMRSVRSKKRRNGYLNRRYRWRGYRPKWWLGKFGQPDKWKICLRAARMPHIRSDNGETSTSDAQSGFQGEGGPGCHQGREDAGRPGAAV